MKKMILLMSIILIVIVTGCSNKGKLSDLGYSEIDIDKIETNGITNELINNKIDFQLYRDVLNTEGFAVENQKVYFKLLNQVFNFEEINLLIKGVNALINKDEKFLQDEFLNANNAKEVFDQNLTPEISLSKREFEASKNEDDVDLTNYVVAKSLIDQSNPDEISVSEKIDLSIIGERKVIIKVKDRYGYAAENELTIKVIDSTKPTISFNTSNDYYENQEINYKSDFVCVDNIDGDLSANVVVEVVEGDLKSTGVNKVKYTVTDASSNKLEYVRTINIIKLYSLGEAFEIGQYALEFISYKYTDVDSEAQTGYYSYYDADEGQTFMVFKLKVTNDGKEETEPFDIWDDKAINAAIEFGDGYIYEDTPHMLDNNWYDYYVSIKPLQSKTLNLTFEIPDSLANSSERKMLKVFGKDISEVTYVTVD